MSMDIEQVVGDIADGTICLELTRKDCENFTEKVLDAFHGDPDPSKFRDAVRLAWMDMCRAQAQRIVDAVESDRQAERHADRQDRTMADITAEFGNWHRQYWGKS